MVPNGGCTLCHHEMYNFALRNSRYFWRWDMTVTVRSLLELEEAHLVCVAGASGLDRAICRVHVSEMLDPTLWMKGGEFLLTTGIRLVDDAVIHEYLDRLCDHGIAGVGFSTGNTFGMHRRVPPAFIARAESRGLPVLDVPIEASYVQISEFVSAHLAAEQHRLTQRAFDAQRRLSSAALTVRGRTEVVRLLASLVNGWAAVTTATGRVIDVFPSSARRRLDVLEADLLRVRDTGAVASVSDTCGGSIGIHPLGAPGNVRRILVVSKESAFDAFDQMVTASAVALLSFETEQQLCLSPQRAAASDVLGAVLLRAKTLESQIERAAAGLGLNPRKLLRVARISAPRARAKAVARLVHDVFSAREITSVTVTEHDAKSTYSLIVQEQEPVEGALRDLVTRLDGDDSRMGISSPVALADIELAHRQASVALAQAMRTSPRSAVAFDELSAYHSIIGLVAPREIDAVTATILSPVDRLDGGADGGLYKETLKVFLAHNGRWESAARELGIHRQTLSKRIASIERHIGSNLESPDTRMALWFALQARAASRNF